MKCLAVYQSKSGYTKRYMIMLSEAAEVELVELKSANPDVLRGYDCILYAGGLYSGKISGLKKFIRMLGSHRPKRWLLVGVGASPGTEALRLKLLQDNLDEGVIAHTGRPEFFYLQGGFDPERLNFALKAMLGMVSKNLAKKQMKNPESMTEEDRAFLDFFQTANDQTSVEQLMPIVEVLRHGGFSP